jgi:hypothetical protein
MSLITSITTSGTTSRSNYGNSSLLLGNENWIQPNSITYTSATSYMANSIN